MGPLQTLVREHMGQRHPMMLRGLVEARAISPEVVDTNFEKCLKWIVESFSEDALKNIVDGYAIFTLEVNRAQIAYEIRGTYEFSTFAEANSRVYQHAEYMKNYYWGIFAILFCWSHYVELMEFFLSRFVRELKSGRLLEVAPGHGIWGCLAIQGNPHLSLEGWDISPTSLEMATRIAAGAGLSKRASYKIGDATQIRNDEPQYDSGLCCFMLEHLEDPGDFLKKFAHNLKKGAPAFVTLALTAAQTDHIYEFKHESEAVKMAQLAGFEIMEERIARPMRQARGAKFVPRVQAMLLRKK